MSTSDGKDVSDGELFQLVPYNFESFYLPLFETTWVLCFKHFSGTQNRYALFICILYHYFVNFREKSSRCDFNPAEASISDDEGVPGPYRFS
jgi:hypothetical protein